MTEETTQEVQLTPKESRQMEVDSYSTNIEKYTNILSTLDGVWDKDLIHLKDIETQEAARQCEMNRLERLAELQLHNQLEKLLKTEIVERFKAQAILDSF
jgi:hypothetical protein